MKPWKSKLTVMTVKVLKFISILVVALLAGTSFGIWMGLNPVAYSPSTYLEQQQNLVSSLNAMMVALVVLETLVTIALAFRLRQNNTVFMALLFAAACFASCIFISRFGNLPIQKEMLTWDGASLPDHWTTRRDRWWFLHKLRTIAELAGLVLVTWTIIFRQETKLFGHS